MSLAIYFKIEILGFIVKQLLNAGITFTRFVRIIVLIPGAQSELSVP